ncbi:MAG: type I methionyl aminopeptidase [Armatimonadetes bacterium]|nr:type I methionyl aminopeptidase [Armatimonadota bacterium]
MIEYKSDNEVQLMRESGRITGQTLDLLARTVQPGMTTGELDRLAEDFIRKQGAVPAFKGYRGFPKTVCISVNDEVVHGIPGNRKLKDGDIVGFDMGVIWKGWYSDSARTVAVGRIEDKAQRLLEVTRESLFKGIEKCLAGGHLYDISNAVQNHVEGHGYSVVRDLVGHGIGRNLHEEPQVPNYGPAGHGPKLRTGLVLAIEPMVNYGTHKVLMKRDNWTIVTEDGSLSAHFEHTVAITKNGPIILTLPDD